MTNLRAPLVLPEGVEFTVVEKFDQALRDELGAVPGDVAVTRQGARTPTSVIGAEGAALLLHFRRPETIARAVVRFARALDCSPEQVLQDSLPLVQRMLLDGMLAVVGDDGEVPGASAGVAAVQPGDRVDRFEVVRVLQALEDTSVALGRDGDAFVVLKVGAADGSNSMDPGFQREAAWLTQLADHPGVPDLVAHDADHERCWLAATWCRGAPLADTARGRRQDGDARGLAQLLVAVAGAYADLHARGVLHVDVHPGNVLIDAADRAVLVDLGAAAPVGTDGRHRPGVAFYREPEFARAALASEPPPPPTVAGEQYAVAAMLFEVAGGSPPAGHRLNEQELWEAIAHDDPPHLPMDSPLAGSPIEAVLRVGLASDPAARHTDLAALRDALVAVEPPAATPAVVLQGPVERFVSAVQAELDVTGAVYASRLEPGPLAGTSSGAGGVAVGLGWLATRRGDPELFAHARAWARLADRARGHEHAFESPKHPIGEDARSDASVLHGDGGLSVALGWLAATTGTTSASSSSEGSSPARTPAPAAGVLAADGSEVPGDLTLGSLGTVLSCAHLLEALPMDHADTAALHDAGRRRLEEDWAAWADATTSVHPGADAPNLGAAHGVAGRLVAALRWRQATGQDLPPGFDARLAWLLDQRLPRGRGANIPWNLPGGSTEMVGWCNGAAGVLHLLCLHVEVTGVTSHLDAAQEFAHWVAEAPYGGHDLCCGAAGRAVALARFGALVDDDGWTEHARRLVLRAVSHGQHGEEYPNHSLWKGGLGLAVVADDLAAGRPPGLPMLDVLP